MVAYLVCEIENENFCKTCSSFVISDVEIYKKAVVGRLIEIIE